MLSPATLEIWRLAPDAMRSAESLSILHSILSQEEQRRAAAFLAEKDRCTYIAAHAALRVVLSRLTGLSPQVLQFTGENGAKPALAQENNPLDLRFNLSHTQNAILIATTTGREIGVDIEWHRPVADLEEMAGAVMGSSELAAWKLLGTQPRIDAFYHLWTRKEAYLKAIGLGLYRELQSITVPVSATFLTSPVSVDDRHGETAVKPWQLCDLPAWEGYSAAVCWQGADMPPIAIHDLTLASLTFDSPL